MRILVKKTDGLTVPKNGSSVSAGYDIVATSDPIIRGELDPDNVKKDTWIRIDYIEYETGISIAPQKDSYQNNYHTHIFPRSSLSNYNLVLANSVAVIDNDYRGKLGFRFKYIVQPADLIQRYSKMPGSDGGSDYTWEPNGFSVKVDYAKIYKKGDRLGQLVAAITHPIEFEVVEELDSTERGEGGFGSTGTSVKGELEAFKHIVESMPASLVEDQLIRIREKAVAVKTTEHIEHDKTVAEVSNILKQWREKIGTVSTPVGYEKLIKERDNKE